MTDLSPFFESVWLLRSDQRRLNGIVGAREIRDRITRPIVRLAIWLERILP